jgi:hypothetical protein
VPNLTPETIVDVHVGDSGRLISWLWKNPDGQTARNLTGYGCRISFCYADAVPHVERDCWVDGPNGLTFYRLRGDEYTAEGLVLRRFQLMPPDWYLGGAPGRSFLRRSSSINKVNVKAVPA